MALLSPEGVSVKDSTAQSAAGFVVCTPGRKPGLLVRQPLFGGLHVIGVGVAGVGEHPAGDGKVGHEGLVLTDLARRRVLADELLEERLDRVCRVTGLIESRGLPGRVGVPVRVLEDLGR